MNTLSEYTHIIDEAIGALSYSTGQAASLYAPIAYGMQAGGKRLRPVLTLMVCDALGAPIESAVMPAVGVEMFHNFTLLHDDVMDNSAVRRGRPSVMAKYGVNAAILSGDTMLTLATQLVAKAPRNAVIDVIDCFNETAIGVYEGQQMDVDFETRDDVTTDEYIEMIRLKTSVLLGGAAKIGALVAGADADTAARFYRFAELLGIAFQIKDDYLDVYGDSATFGKPIGGDILNNKKTFLLLTASGSSHAAQLTEALAIDDDARKIESVRAVYDAIDMRGRCRDTINGYTARALATLDELKLTAEAHKAFRDLAVSLTTRDK